MVITRSHRLKPFVQKREVVPLSDRCDLSFIPDAVPICIRKLLAEPDVSRAARPSPAFMRVEPVFLTSERSLVFGVDLETCAFARAFGLAGR